MAEFDRDEAMFRIIDSTQYDYAITVTWIGEGGAVESGWGVVREIDAEEDRIKLVCDWDAR